MYGAVTGLATARAAPERRTYAYPRVPGNSWVGQSVLCLAWLWETQNQLCVALIVSEQRPRQFVTANN